MISVNWTARALSALEGIYDYISQDAPIYAEHFVQQLISAVDRLEEFPLSGRNVPESERDDIREVIFQNYRIIYWLVNDTQIDIVSVMHSSRDLHNSNNQPWDAP
jgi:toxin ParE1/3/4